MDRGSLRSGLDLVEFGDMTHTQSLPRESKNKGGNESDGCVGKQWSSWGPSCENVEEEWGGVVRRMTMRKRKVERDNGLGDSNVEDGLGD